jgi:hypothetical protein
MTAQNPQAVAVQVSYFAGRTGSLARWLPGSTTLANLAIYLTTVAHLGLFQKSSLSKYAHAADPFSLSLSAKLRRDDESYPSLEMMSDFRPGCATAISFSNPFAIPMAI